MFGVIMPLCNRMFCCIFGWYFYIEIRLKYEKIILLSSSRAFSLSTRPVVYSISYGKQCCLSVLENFQCLPPLFWCLPLWKTVRLHGKKLQNATERVDGGVKNMIWSVIFWVYPLTLICCYELVCFFDSFGIVQKLYTLV